MVVLATQVESPLRMVVEFAVPDPSRAGLMVPDVINAALLGSNPFKDVTPLRVPEPTVIPFKEVTKKIVGRSAEPTQGRSMPQTNSPISKISPVVQK